MHVRHTMDLSQKPGLYEDAGVHYSTMIHDFIFVVMYNVCTPRIFDTVTSMELVNDTLRYDNDQIQLYIQLRRFDLM